MPDLPIHVYELLPLDITGVVMGIVLILVHLVAVVRHDRVLRLLNYCCRDSRPGQVLMIIDFLWIFLLLLRAPWNPLCMDLFDFERLRTPLLWACVPICAMLCCYSKQAIMGRALGLFFLLLGIIPLTAAYLKEPATRILIPLWWYPVLTASVFWLAKPYLLRDWVDWLSRHRTVYRVSAWVGLLYGGTLLICAILYY